MGVRGSAGGRVNAYISARIFIKMDEGRINYIDWGMFGLEYTNIHMLAKPSVA